MQENNIERAGEFAREALALAGRHNEGLNVADAHIWLGRVAGKVGGPEGTDREFAQAIQGFEQLGRRESLFHAHGIYAEILERRGEVAQAYAHMKKALEASRPGGPQMQQEEEKERPSTARPRPNPGPDPAGARGGAC